MTTEAVAETILVVEDDPDARRALGRGLADEGWRVVEARDKASLLAALQRERIDLITLDLMLGAEDGLDLAREVRAVRNVPVVMITGKAEPLDRVRGLETGADDYIIKPFHIREVVLRIRQVLERYRTELSGDEPVLFDHSSFDPRRRLVRHLDGSPVELTELELKLLEVFVRHPGRILSRDEICRALHGREWSPYDRTIDGLVARLRRKIEPEGDAPTLIRSVRGVGYTFSGDVRSAATPDRERRQSRGTGQRGKDG